jgi:hypothetical protein
LELNIDELSQTAWNSYVAFQVRFAEMMSSSAVLPSKRKTKPKTKTKPKPKPKN